MRRSGHGVEFSVVTGGAKGWPRSAMVALKIVRSPRVAFRTYCAQGKIMAFGYSAHALTSLALAEA